MVICECCGEDVLDMELHFPCECKFSINRLWIVEFDFETEHGKEHEKHIARKVMFTMDWFELEHVDGSSYKFQANLVENYAIRPLKIGLFRNMPESERTTALACWDDMWRAMNS
jgi:hypothetical protein